MKAVIMAGGEGRRLRPVTGGGAKPMAELLGRSLMEHIILLLRKNGFEEICAAVKYRASDIMDYFGDGSKFGVSLSYALEEKPLGTAGCVKNCRDFYKNEDFLVISGDAACDFDLRELVEKHREKGADMSIALYKSPEPLAYGLVLADSDCKILSFIEKPSWERVVTDCVNTGIYVISPELMETVPENEPCDFGNELFPELLRRGMGIYGFPLDGYWCDVGTPLSYYKCCVDALEGRLSISPGPAFQQKPPERARTEVEDCSVCLEYPCKSRAALMAALSEEMISRGADFSDGIRLTDSRGRLHICPLSHTSALRIAVSSQDTEFARSLAFSAKELLEAMDK